VQTKLIRTSDAEDLCSCKKNRMNENLDQCFIQCFFVFWGGFYFYCTLFLFRPMFADSKWFGECVLVGSLSEDSKRRCASCVKVD
jgi:hypothetical protein